MAKMNPRYISKNVLFVPVFGVGKDVLKLFILIGEDPDEIADYKSYEKTTSQIVSEKVRSKAVGPKAIDLVVLDGAFEMVSNFEVSKKLREDGYKGLILLYDNFGYLRRIAGKGYEDVIDEKLKETGCDIALDGLWTFELKEKLDALLNEKKLVVERNQPFGYRVFCDSERLKSLGIEVVKKE